jgi:hypothetical protein
MSLLWPLILVVEDCYEPESAAALFEGLRGVSDEGLAVTIILWAMAATTELSLN